MAELPMRCPICDATATPEDVTYPFCSWRCKKVDLANWLSGERYVVRGLEPADEEEEQSQVSPGVLDRGAPLN